MNYRHAYHAGNFADVLKHAVLSLVIEHLKLKPAPFRVIDTHAGTGSYDLHGEEAVKTGEWRDGIARLLETEIPPTLVPLLAPYLATVTDGQDLDDAPLRHYPGSPLIARRLMRPIDKLVANELHTDDADDLARLFHRDKQVRVTNMDGWTALKANLPPVERRGVILIDPPFEEAGELQRLTSAVGEMTQRFATGTLMLWYPVKDPSQIVSFERQLSELRTKKMLRLELLLRAPNDTSLLNGNGLIVLNPPYTLFDNLSKLLPFLTELLARGAAPSWRLDWLSE